VKLKQGKKKVTTNSVTSWGHLVVAMLPSTFGITQLSLFTPAASNFVGGCVLGLPVSKRRRHLWVEPRSFG